MSQPDGPNAFCHIKDETIKVVTCITLPATAFSQHKSQIPFLDLRPPNEFLYLVIEAD
jgi:hypothetical protein